jgi:hypothetical protein
MQSHHIEPYVTCQTDFPLISTIFDHWACNLTWNITMYMKLFHILLTNVQNALKKYFVRSEVNTIKIRQKNNIQFDA